MTLLRAMLIAFLAISMTLPATAAAFGVPPCMEVSAEKTTGLGAAAGDEQTSDTAQQNECGCEQCDACAACDAPCATGGTATFNDTPLVFTLPLPQAARAMALRTRTLPAHPEDLIRPPSLIQS